MNQIPEGWQVIKFDDFTTLQRGKDLTKNSFKPGNVPVAGSNGVIGYHNESFVKAPGITVGRSGSCGKVNYYDVDFWAHNTSLYVRDFHGNDVRFAGYFLEFLDLGRFHTGASVPTLDRNSFKELPLTVPNIQEQHRIAYVLSTVQTAVEQQARLIALTCELKSVLMHKLFTEGLRGEEQKQAEIGLMPESWDIVAFSEGVDIKNGQVDPREGPYSQMLHVGPENIERDTGRLISLQTNEALGIKSGNYHFTPDDILYSKIRPYLNKVALPDFEGTCSADMYPLRPRKDYFSRRFLFHLLLSEVFKKQAVSHQDRTGIPKINRNQLGSTSLPKPSISEQNQIAASLDILDSKISVTELKRSLLEELFRTLLHQLMTAQIRVNELDL